MGLQLATRDFAFEADDGRPQPEFFQPPTGGIAVNGLPILSWDEAAAQIARGGFSWSTAPGSPAVVTYAFRADESDATLSDFPAGVSGFSRFSAAQITVAEEMLSLWSEAANITFVRVGSGVSGEGAYSNNASILFGNFITGPSAFSAFTFLPAATATGSGHDEGDIWVNVSRNYDAQPDVFSLGAHILAHEIGHAIGLLHPGDYNSGGNGGNTYASDAEYWQDSAMFSNMSYFGAANTGGLLATNALTPLMHDIAAAQYVYGVNSATRTGDTTYGFNSNAGHAAFAISASSQTVVFCIWDGGGVDTLDLSGYSSNSEIDLRPEAFSSAGPGSVYNISIARGVVVENGVGGAGDDTIIGNDAANRLVGNGGGDIIFGGSGDDVIDGGSGADAMSGGAGNDVYSVDNLSDVITEIGGAGTDVALVSVSGYTLGANVEVGAIQGVGLTLTGNNASNILYGASGADTLNGGDGDDTLQGGANSDTLVGGLGNDTFYVAQPGDTVVENNNEGFDATIVQMTTAYTLADNVEVGATFLGSGVNITGNGLDNLLYGNAGADTLNGAGGNDFIQGAGGNDTMAGGTGNDTYFIEDAGDVITENANEGIDAAIVFTSSYTLAANVEVGARFLTTAYTLTGNALDNQLYGNNGNDMLNGGDGNDTIQGGGGNDTMVGGLGNDTYLVEQAGDIVTENANEGSDAVIVLIGSYTLAANVEVGATFLTTGVSITGNGLTNRLYGNFGADMLNGAAGADLLDGGAGADTLTGGSENDTFFFVAGQANGDTITDFDGAGAGSGDALRFAGYGAAAGGATFVQIDATHWQINSADGLMHDTVTLANGASVDSSDWLFV